MWRTTADIYPTYHRVIAIMDDMATLSSTPRASGHNDPDMLEVGVNGTLLNVPFFPATSLTPKEAQLHFVMWAMLAAPLIIGADLRSAPEWVVDILGHEEVIEIDQDPLFQQATMIRDDFRGRHWR